MRFGNVQRRAKQEISEFVKNMHKFETAKLNILTGENGMKS